MISKYCLYLSGSFVSWGRYVACMIILVLAACSNLSTRPIEAQGSPLALTQAGAPPPNAAPEPAPLTQGALNFVPVARDLQDFAYLLRQSAWRWRAFEPHNIYVCWENPEPSYQAQMAMVQRSIADTWQKNSSIVFVWQSGPCTSRRAGIHIQIADVGPHTAGLGIQLDAQEHGMVLNFAFNNWSPTCKQASMYELCVKSIAVHEFGHALGFSHEQNRPDTPGECALRAQGGNGDLMLTSWDIHSVMNYCNAEYNNNGELSQGDIYALQSVYLKPRA